MAPAISDQRLLVIACAAGTVGALEGRQWYGAWVIPAACLARLCGARARASLTRTRARRRTGAGMASATMRMAHATAALLHNAPRPGGIV